MPLNLWDFKFYMRIHTPKCDWLIEMQFNVPVNIIKVILRCCLWICGTFSFTWLETHQHNRHCLWICGTFSFIWLKTNTIETQALFQTSDSSASRAPGRPPTPPSPRGRGVLQMWKTSNKFYFTRYKYKKLYLSRLMRLWHLTHSVNSIFKHACAAIHWRYTPEPSLFAYAISTIISWAGSFYVGFVQQITN